MSLQRLQLFSQLCFCLGSIHKFCVRKANNKCIHLKMPQIAVKLSLSCFYKCSVANNKVMCVGGPFQVMKG